MKRHWSRTDLRPSSLRELAGAAGDVLVFTSSTTAAVESAVQNLFSPGG